MLAFFVLCLLGTTCFAANGYDFEMNYTGDLIKGQEKAIDMVLIGDGTSSGYSKVRIKVEISGPSTPRLLATNSSGSEIDIAQTGYWGADDGVAVPATVRNVTPVRATFDQAGEYRIKLSLINKEAADAVITTKEIVMTVSENTPVNNTVANETTNQVVENVPTNDEIEELPKTGASVAELIAYGTAVVGLLLFAMYRMKKVN